MARVVHTTPGSFATFFANIDGYLYKLSISCYRVIRIQLRHNGFSWTVVMKFNVPRLS